jgi:beta-barrel assembly-enhancing protease
MQTCHLRPSNLSAPSHPVLKLDHPPARSSRSRLLALACAATLLCPASVPNALAQNTLPALGDAVSQDFGVGAERKLGDQIMREIRRDPDYLDDPVLLEYLQSIWQPLVAQARARGNIGADIDQRFAWEPFLVRDRSVNAFALPGGFVGVHLGLMALTSTRDELASVLAHEMSHVTQRHIARSITNNKQQSLIGIATLIVGVLAASRSRSIDAANAVLTGGQAAAIQGQLNFSRDMEREADRVGFQVMTGAGFAPGGMAAMFEKLEQSSRLNDAGGYPYLRSHPLTSERIGEARARMGTAPPAAPVSRLEHTAAQARSRVMMDTRFDALHRWQSLDGDRVASTPADKLLNLYESALASTLLRDWARADAAISAAAELVRNTSSKDPRAERAIALLNVQSLLARGDVTRAVAALAPYATDGSRPTLLLAAQAALAAAPPGVVPEQPLLKQQADQLRTWVAIHPHDALAWTALKQIDERLGLPLLAVRADAESRVAIADFDGAADRLQAGQRRARSGAAVDFIDLSVIDARLRDVEQLRRQQKADEKSLR